MGFGDCLIAVPCSSLQPSNSLCVAHSDGGRTSWFATAALPTPCHAGGVSHSHTMRNACKVQTLLRSAGANDPSAQLVPVDVALPDSMRRWTAPPVDLAALYPNYQQGLLQSSGGGVALQANGTAPAAAVEQHGVALGSGLLEPDTPPPAPPAVLTPAQA